MIDKTNIMNRGMSNSPSGEQFIAGPDFPRFAEPMDELVSARAFSESLKKFSEYPIKGTKVR